MVGMDRQKLRGLVFEKTGIKVDSDNPIFALVALNEAVLADTVERQVALLAAAAQELAQQARAAGGIVTAGCAPAPAASSAATAGRAAPLFEPREWRLLGGAGVVALLSAALALAGQALLARPAAAPPTPAEGAARAEKLARAVQKLDPAGQALIRSEMQKP
ncbi:hypothetical protein [Janthinobacterium sp.]|uniref:hypothetical protein n=1 Tax=Janthinobacterium sp. TaxID=1871054 RepID=UPI00293D825B|nr:hypothetical protein [Janthinobacterium sp.]